MGTVIENIAEASKAIGQVELGGHKLESAEASLLDVSQFSLDEHVAMQPAAIAYYGMLKKQAARKLAALEREFDRWQRKKYAEAKVLAAASAARASDVKVEDVKSRFIVENEAELEKWDKRLDKAQLEYDTLDMWYEAWRQKSFSIREHVSITEDERYNTEPSMGSGNPGSPPRGRAKSEQKALSSERMSRVRDIIRKRKEKESSQQA